MSCNNLNACEGCEEITIQNPDRILAEGNQSHETVKKIRRYDIDWLRVILFALLIPFHVGIGVYWDAYDFVQPEHSVEENAKREDLNADAGEEAVNVYSFLGGGIISYILTWMHEWRLAALFMISGMGTAFAFKRRTWKLFLKELLLYPAKENRYF